MRKIIVLGLSILAYTTSFGQTNTFPADGGVGIGTLNPMYKFQINGGHNGTTMNLHHSNPNPLWETDLTLWASEPGWTYTGTGIGNNVYNSSSSLGVTRINTVRGGSYMRFLDQEIKLNVVKPDGKDISALAVDPSGNVGIGTDKPENSEGWERVLEVKGVSHSKVLVSNDLVSAGLWSHPIGYYGAPAGGITGTFTNHPFSIMTNRSTKMTIAANGNVGIGTPSPADKLSVNGNIRAHEIKVEVKNWPDYVFVKSYRLPSLSETEKFIMEKGHLPGIPSALEVKTNGIELGEINAKLLQKIEELTLHLIQKEKQNEDQEMRIKKLEELYAKSKSQ